MKKYLLTAGCGFALLVVSSCNKEEIGAYTPIPKLHLGEPFTKINTSVNFYRKIKS